jgi:hypothetical protein
MSFVGDDFLVVLDACVLYPQTLRDLLLRLALAGLYAACFSEQILEEVRSNLVRDGRASEAAASRMVQLIRTNAEECLTDVPTALPTDLRLPDPDDLHVVQTAVAAGAAQIPGDAFFYECLRVQLYPPHRPACVKGASIHEESVLKFLL